MVDQVQVVDEELEVTWREIVTPDWSRWQLAMVADPDFFPLFEAIPKMANSMLSTLIGQVADRPDTVNQISLIWAGLNFPVEVRARWKQLAIAHHLPQQFVDVI